MIRRILQFLAVILLAAVVSPAQQPGPLVYVAAFRVHPDKASDFMNFVKNYDQPTFEKLMSEGAILNWGLDSAVLHHKGEPTHYLFWAMPNAAAYDKVAAGLEEMYKKVKADDDQRAAEARKRGQPAPKGARQLLLESTDMEQHFDYLFSTLVSNIKPVPAGTLPYLAVTRFRVERGKSRDFQKTWEKYSKPIYEKLLAEGTILGYGLINEEYVSQEPATHWVWVRFASSAADDQINAAFRAERERRSEEERAAITKQFMDLVVAGSAHDDLLHAEIFSTVQK